MPTNTINAVSFHSTAGVTANVTFANTVINSDGSSGISTVDVVTGVALHYALVPERADQTATRLYEEYLVANPGIYTANG